MFRSTLPRLGRCAVLATAVATALAAHAGTAPPDPFTPDPCTPGEPCSTLDLPLVHPLLGAALSDGRVPVLDVKNASNGKRYAVEESNYEAQEGHLLEHSGVVKLNQRRPGANERAQLQAEKIEANGGVPPVYDDTDAPKIGDGLRTAMAHTPPTARLAVQLRVNRPDDMSNTVEDLERAIARGQIHTRRDEYSLRQQLITGRQQSVAQAQQPVIDRIGQLGGQVTNRFTNLFGLDAQLTPSQIRSLAGLDAVERMDIAVDASDQIHGQDVSLGTQITQLINHGYDGENGSDTDITFAVFENGKVHDDHLGFVDSSSAGSSPRIRGRYDCDGSGCTFESNFTSPGSHATGVNGIVFGDLRDGQDPGVTDSLVRKQKSGYAGEARGYMYAINYTSGGYRDAVDDVFGRTYTPHAINMSFGFDTDDPKCEGDTTVSKDANDLFEEGMLPIVAAGNTAGSSTDCTVTSPGSAIGAYTVGGQGDAITGGNSNDVSTAAISSFSAMGGVSSTEGINRSIIDSTAYACREDLFDTSGGYSYTGCGTSFAAPTVTAAAVDFVDFYKNYKSDLIDDPGILFAQLLLMGDRQSQSGGSLLNYFDSLWGAGRTKMRELSSAGMDSPYGWGTGYTCVDDGQTVTININGGAALSTDVDYLKAVIYWYDPRHAKGKSVSDLDLRLKTTSGSTLTSSLDSYDNKERVFNRSVGGQAVKLEINGYDVKTDTTSCGSNSMKVYYAWFYEDGDRDDSDGPGPTVDPE